MNLDWKLLVRVREQHRSRAQQQVVQARQAAAAAQAQAQSAQAAWQEEVQARSGLWASLQSAPQGLDVAALRQASAWSRTLDGRIQQAATVVAHAEGAVQQQARRLDERREALRGAAGNLHKAEEMRDRANDAAARAQQLRADDTLDDTAAQVWARRSR